jgi:hypothetical protein
MDQRVSAQSDPGLPIESPALRSILRNGDKVQTTVETTPNGAIVTQTSGDSETVRALQEHAAEVTDLVQRGMVAIHEAMMKNGGMHGGMMGRAEPQAPNHGAAMPAGMTHEQHMAQMKKEAEMKQHGNAAMGFDQDRTTHHFMMTSDGGSIAVDANDPDDQASIAQIRTHLQEIAIAFKQGDFRKPYETHSEYAAGNISTIPPVFQHPFRFA